MKGVFKFYAVKEINGKRYAIQCKGSTASFEKLEQEIITAPVTAQKIADTLPWNKDVEEGKAVIMVVEKGDDKWTFIYEVKEKIKSIQLDHLFTAMRHGELVDIDNKPF